MDEISDIIKKFKQIDTSEFPDFFDFDKTLEKGLWVLWVVKSKCEKKELSADEIALILKDVKEVRLDAKSITNAFNMARDKVYVSHKGGSVFFEIMKPGKEYLLAQKKGGSIQVLYFEPDKRYSSKRLLAKNVLENLKGGLRMVDPYFGERTLDILKDIKQRPIKFLTRTDNLLQKAKDKILRELKDFEHENPGMEFRNYPNTELHDRYIISSDYLVLLGHSIKDLGTKESFAIVLSKETSKNVLEALRENFDRRWKQSSII